MAQRETTWEARSSAAGPVMEKPHAQLDSPHFRGDRWVYAPFDEVEASEPLSMEEIFRED